MGFTPKRKVYTLDFTDTDYDGFEVTLRGLTTGELLDAMERHEAATQDSNSEAFRELLQLIADKCVTWNLDDDDGKPLPPTLDVLRDQDPQLPLAINRAWTTAVSAVPAPLGSGSDAGPPSVEESIPMETLSESLAS